MKVVVLRAKSFEPLLAIVDDIGAIVVIAVFYTSDLEPMFLVLAAGVVVVVAVIHRLDVTYPPIILGFELLLWLMIYESGVHATIAGVMMGLLTPGVARQTDLEADEVVDVLENRCELHTAREDQDAAGTGLVRDAGVITFADTFDLATGDFISPRVSRQQGSTPRS